jgi:hypothetical protein
MAWECLEYEIFQVPSFQTLSLFILRKVIKPWISHCTLPLLVILLLVPVLRIGYALSSFWNKQGKVSKIIDYP